MTQHLMTAAVASADVYDVVIDGIGDVWLRHGQVWAYLTEDGVAVADQRDQLPATYEPYVGLSHAAAQFVLKGVMAR